jgi:hypothetical protein
VKVHVSWYFIAGFSAMLVGFMMWVSGDEVSSKEVEQYTRKQTVVVNNRRRVAVDFKRNVMSDLNPVASRICAHFAGTSLFPNILIYQGDDVWASIELIAADGGKADVWCGDIPLGLLNGTVLEDVRVLSEGYSMTMLVFTFWLRDGTRYDRIKLLSQRFNKPIFSTWRNGIPWHPFAEYALGSEGEEDDDDEVEIIEIERNDIDWTKYRGDKSVLDFPPTVSLYPWCPVDCMLQQGTFYLEVNDSGIFAM